MSHIDTPVLVLHDVGDERGGAPWSTALLRAGWEGPILAPDLPGHAGAAPPEGGNYELADGVLTAARLLADSGDDQPRVIVGVGVNGWSAHVLALAGRATALVLIDGLGGPWLSPEDAIHLSRDWLRAVADDSASMAAPPPGCALDPRLRHGVLAPSSPTLVRRAAGATAVPTLLLRSPSSALSRPEVASVAPEFAGPVASLEVADADPETVAGALVRWAREGVSTSSPSR
jgi:pimeloyl-ACP methyl ester carboxylesterase